LIYRGLDTFRLLAFLAVFLYHVHVMEVGYLGVLAFFVLSGFLITPILVEMRGELTGTRFFINFYGRRCLRIFPLYYAYLAAMAACAGLALLVDGLPRAIQQISSQIGYALTYSYDFFHASRGFTQSPLLTHFWSLAVEEQFYLVWPLVVFCVPRPRLKAVLLAMIAAGPLFRLVEAALIASPVGGVFNQRMDLTIYVLPFSHIDAFAIGGYLALYGRTPSRSTVAFYSAALVTVGLVTERLATGSMGPALGYGPFMADSWKSVWAYTGLNLLFGWVLLLTRERAFLRPVMEQPTLSYLGRISYGLYVYHFAVIWLVSLIVQARLAESPAFGRKIVLITSSLAITIAISMVSYAILEAPFLRLKDRFFVRSAAVAPAAVPQPVTAAAGPLQGT
jgi:peptidoglycan/LPS O-acetylase OafA/YrhL